MLRLRVPLLATALAALLAPPAHAIVGGTAVPEGGRPYVAYVSIDGVFACTGTLVAPTVVLTAGHCGSVSGAAVATPIGQPGQAIEVSLGSVRPGEGEKPGVRRVIVHPDYSFANVLLSDRETDVSNDVALLELATPSSQRPVPIAAVDERDLWAPGRVAQIAGFGTTSSGGETPDTMRETEVPIVEDAVAATAYTSFEPGTQLGAGLPQGGRDSCQGDSGGPLLVPAADGSLRLVGDTSYGDGCGQPGKPGIYGRLAGEKLRAFVARHAPAALAPERPVTTAMVDRRPLIRALDSGVRLRVRCTVRCRTVSTLRVDRATARRYGLRSRTVARAVRRRLQGRDVAQLRFTADARRALRRARTVVLTVRVVSVTANGKRKVVTRRLTLRR